MAGVLGGLPELAGGADAEGIPRVIGLRDERGDRRHIASGHCDCESVLARLAPYLMAAQSAALPSVIIYDTGLEALPIRATTVRLRRRPWLSCRPTAGMACFTWSG